MSVGVLEVLKAMEETAQVIALGCFKKLSLVVILLLLYVISFFFFNQLFFLHVLHLADQMHFANKAATGPSVPAIWASKATDTTAQVFMHKGIFNVNLPSLSTTTTEILCSSLCHPL